MYGAAVLRTVEITTTPVVDNGGSRRHPHRGGET